MDCGFLFMLINQELICYFKLGLLKLEEFNCILLLWIMKQKLNSKNQYLESKKYSSKDQGNYILFYRTALSF